MPGPGRPSIHLEPYKADILAQYQEDIPLEQIINTLSEQSGIQISRYTLNRRIRDWGIQPRQTRVQDTSVLRERLRFHYCNGCPTDAQLLRLLVVDGFTLSLTA